MSDMEGVKEKQQLLLKLEAGDSVDVGDRVVKEGGGATVVLIFSVFVAVCGSFVTGCAIGYSSPTQSGIIAELGLSTEEYSLFGTVLTVGVLLGSLVCGKLADCIGRKGAMALSNLLFVVGWLAIAFSKGVWSLDLGRMAGGFAMALNGYAVPVYVAEITPKNLRGGAGLLIQLMISCGMSLFYLIGLTVTWRILSLIGTVPCLIQLLGLIFIPESPRWLIKVGRDKSCEAVLQRLRGKKVDISQEAAEIKDYTEAAQNVAEDRFLDVFQMKYAYALHVTIGLMTLAALSGTNGIVFYASEIFDSAGFSGTIGTAAMALMQLPPVIIGVFLMDNCGRRPLLLYSASGMFTACLLVALSFLMKQHSWMENFSPYLAFFGILMYSAVFPLGLGGIPSVLMSEIFPINIKGAAGSLASLSASVSAGVVSYTFNIMMEWSSSGTFLIFAGINLCTVVFIAKLVPETKGRTLEEIQESLIHTSE